MRTFLLSLLFALSLGTCSWAAHLDDVAFLNEEFKSLTALELFLEQRNVTYTELATEQNEQLRHLANDHQDISGSLLTAVAPMSRRLRDAIVLITLLGLAVLGCLLLRKGVLALDALLNDTFASCLY